MGNVDVEEDILMSFCIDQQIAMMNRMVDKLDDLTDNNTYAAMKLARNALDVCGMDDRYRDLMVSRMDFTIEVDFESPEQLADFEAMITRLVTKFYKAFHDEGFSDEAIAEMGSQIQVSMS